LIREGCSDSGELAIQIGKAYREWSDSIGPVSSPQAKRGRERIWYETQCIVYTAQEGNDRRGGFAVLQGELIGLHHVDKGLGDWLMRAAVDAGADCLNCFEHPHLLDLYTRHGFRTVSVVTNTTKGGPAVHYMERNV
jgi:hypothetical protein